MNNADVCFEMEYTSISFHFLEYRKLLSKLDCRHQGIWLAIWFQNEDLWTLLILRFWNWITIDYVMAEFFFVWFSGPNGINDVHEHAFFTNIEWDKLRQKLIEPPFKPTVVSDEAFYFDSSFTSKTPKGNFLIDTIRVIQWDM